MLTSLGGGGDANNLARAALQDQEIANADVMTRNGDGVGRSHGAGWDAGDGSRSCGVEFGGADSLS